MLIFKISISILDDNNKQFFKFLSEISQWS